MLIADYNHIIILGHVWVDGKDVSSAIIRSGNFSPVARSGVKLKDGRLRPFTFAELNLTGELNHLLKQTSRPHRRSQDDDRLADPRDPTVADVGSVEVRLSWVRLGGSTEFEGYDASNRGLVHEKSKKLGAIYTVYVLDRSTTGGQDELNSSLLRLPMTLKILQPTSSL